MDMNLSKVQVLVKDTGAWHTAVQGVTKIQTRLGNWTTTIAMDINVATFD